MARSSPVTRSPRFRRSDRSRRQHRQPHQRSHRPPVFPDIHGQRPSRVPRRGPLRRIPPASTPTARPPENRFLHRPSPVARGFLPWRKSYTCRCLISFTDVDVQAALSACQFRPLVNVRGDRTAGRRSRLPPGRLSQKGSFIGNAQPFPKAVAALKRERVLVSKSRVNHSASGFPIRRKEH